MNSKHFNFLREFLVLIRVQNLGTSFTAVIGALTVKGFNLYFLDFFMLFLIAVIVNIGGQIINDIKDINIDRCSKELKERPLVKGTISLKSARIIVFLCLISVGLIFVFYFPNVYGIIIISLSFFFGYLYNVFSKKIPGSDFFLSISFALFCLYGAIVVTDNFQSFSDIDIITWIIVAMVFVHLQIMNSIEGGLKDAKNDYESGAKTMAVFMGVRADTELFIPIIFKILSIFYVSISAFIAFIPMIFLNFDYNFFQKFVILLFVLWMFFSVIRLLSFNFFQKDKIKSCIRNLELARYSLVPLVLINIIGIYWAITLILFPIIWFLFFNFLLYGDTWHKPKLY